MYSVAVQHSGRYRFDFRVASPASGGDFHVQFDGREVTGNVHFAATTGWHVWQTVSVTGIQLSAGHQIMRFSCASAGYNLNYIEVIAEDSSPPQVQITTPADGAHFQPGDRIAIATTVSDSNGQVVQVDFFADAQQIGSDSRAPFTFDWQAPSPGKYDLTAVATDNDGEQATSSKIDITVDFPQFTQNLIFSHGRGFYQQPFDLLIAADFSPAQIKYTLDGSNPLTSATAKIMTAPAHIRIDPQDTSGRGRTPAVVLRAAGFKAGVQQTATATHTFIFVEKVRSQQYPGGAWPEENINGQVLNYAVTQQVVDDSRYSGYIEEALLDLPSISLVSDQRHLFAADSGIYVNALFHGHDWERPVSLELLNPDQSPGFQIDAGMRIRGGWSRHNYFPKHAFRVFFRLEYGVETLNFPLFGDEGTTSFRKIDLRTSQNYAWSNGYVNENTMNRDVFSRDLQREMGQPYTRSRYYHLYINGLYWGVYQSQERSEANYAASYFGGNKNDYDVVKVDIGENFNLYDIEATDGNLDGWREVWQAAQKGFADNSAYFAVQGRDAAGNPDPAGRKLIDMDNLIDYMLTIFYTGNFDAPVSKFGGEYYPNNFYAVYNRNDNDGFVFLNHDAEHTLLLGPHNPGIGINEDRVNITVRTTTFAKSNPQYLHVKLMENAEYRMRFADRVYRHMFNGGAMTVQCLTDIFQARAQELDLAIIAESARWGDLQRAKAKAWQRAVDEIVQVYFPRRGAILLNKLRQANLYPQIDPPEFQIKGRKIETVYYSLNAAITLELLKPNSSSGIIYYTVDGSDRRQIGGAVAAAAIDGGTATRIGISGSMLVRARLFSDGQWSAMHEVKFAGVADLHDLELTEIHYHPLDAGSNSGKLYEFIELHNSGRAALDLSLVAFVRGISYTFAAGRVLQPQEWLVLASNAAYFQERYGFAPFAEFTGQLDNGGENLALTSAAGDTLIALRYNDKPPWPVAADGEGYSLVFTNAMGNGDPAQAKNWAASNAIHGPPGAADPATGISENAELPQVYSLAQNYPNPFNPATTIEFSLAAAGPVKLRIFDTLGREVATLVDQTLPQGRHSIRWRAEQLAAGLYFYRLETKRRILTRKALLLK